MGVDARIISTTKNNKDVGDDDDDNNKKGQSLIVDDVARKVLFFVSLMAFPFLCFFALDILIFQLLIMMFLLL
jgi:hypothetical protein